MMSGQVCSCSEVLVIDNSIYFLGSTKRMLADNYIMCGRRSVSLMTSEISLINRK